MYEALEAEQSVISCLIQRAESVEDTYGLLSPEMFDSGILGRMYFEYRNAFDNHKELTLIELHQILAADYPDYEIQSALKDCATKEALPYQIKGFAEVIVKHHKTSCIKEMLNRMELRESEIDDQIDRMITELERFRDGKISAVQTVAEITDKYKGEYFIDREKTSAKLNVEDLDNMIGGFEGGDLIIIGARPAVGKSALVTQWSYMFASGGMKVGFYNLEMTDKQMYERFVAAKSGIEITRIRMATRFHNDEKERFDKANKELSEQNQLFISTGSKKVSDIRADVRHMKYDIVIVDYLQLLMADDRYSGDRNAEVGEISRQLKSIARDFDIPVIALSQLNRASEGRATKEPSMAELRETGNLEQDASVIILMWNKNENDRSEKGLKVEKSRQGKTGRCDMSFDGAHMTFTPEDSIAPFGE